MTFQQPKTFDKTKREIERDKNKNKKFDKHKKIKYKES